MYGNCQLFLESSLYGVTCNEECVIRPVIGLGANVVFKHVSHSRLLQFCDWSVYCELSHIVLYVLTIYALCFIGHP